MEWATSLREKYATDLFFRTTLHVVILQTLLVFVCIAAFILALRYADVRGFFFAGMVFVAAGFGVLLARFTLKPARDTLRYQRLFISNVAHELRTPLSTIKTSTEVALLDPTLTSPMRGTLEEVLGELDRISEIINNLLSLNTLTRPERMQFSNVDLAPLVDIIMRRHIQLARERGIELVVKKDNYCIVWGNATALEQVITNVLKNAISYTPKDGKGVISLSVRPDYRGMIYVSVTDNGIGIAERQHARIFDIFRRLHGRDEFGGGTGAGLTIAKRTIERHGGRLWLTSTPGEGTTFYFTGPPDAAAAAS